MKKSYIKPQAAFESFAVNTSIASGCTTQVNLGPGDVNHEMCKDYAGSWGGFSMYSFGDTPVQTNFYPGSCDCYLDAGEGLMFTS